jgi:hypothetical protein
MIPFPDRLGRMPRAVESGDPAPAKTVRILGADLAPLCPADEAYAARSCASW